MVSVRTCGALFDVTRGKFLVWSQPTPSAARTPCCAKSGTWTGAPGPGESDHPDPIGQLLPAVVAPLGGRVDAACLLEVTGGRRAIRVGRIRRSLHGGPCQRRGRAK